MMHVVQEQRLKGGHVLDPGGRHAAHHPAIEGVDSRNHAELELRQFRTFLRDQVSGRNDAGRSLLTDLDALALAHNGPGPAATIRFALLLHDGPPKIWTQYCDIIDIMSRNS